jgi:hypothetical protein
LTNSQESSAARPDGDERTTCSLCKTDITGNNWFCRVLQKRSGAAGDSVQDIYLCSSACALRYFTRWRQGGAGLEPNYDGFEHSRCASKDGQKEESSKASSMESSESDRTTGKIKRKLS